MNKLLVVLLAVCLVSVHAFVKRDAETPQTDADKLGKDLADLSKNIGNKIQEALNPDQIKKGFSDFIDNINKAFNEMKPKEEAKQ